MTSDSQRSGLCEALCRDGSPCQGRPVLGSPYCVAHHPDSGSWRTRGGHNSSKVARLQKFIPRQLGAVYGTLSDALEEIHKGELEPKKGSAMASVAGSMLRIYEVAAIEERLNRIEEILSKGDTDE